MEIKRLTCLVLSILLMLFYSSVPTLAITEAKGDQKQLQASPNARPIELAFVFDGPSDKNQEVLKVFQNTITKSLLPDYKAVFPKEYIYVGNWTEDSAEKVSEKFTPKQLVTDCRIICADSASEEVRDKYNVVILNEAKQYVSLQEYTKVTFDDNNHTVWIIW